VERRGREQDGQAERCRPRKSGESGHLMFLQRLSSRLVVSGSRQYILVSNNITMQFSDNLAVLVARFPGWAAETQLEDRLRAGRRRIA